MSARLVICAARPNLVSKRLSEKGVKFGMRHKQRTDSAGYMALLIISHVKPRFGLLVLTLGMVPIKPR